ncbi:MAG: hypothetical protein ABSC13_08130 [Dehalococcoidia bacterium]
MSRYLAGAGVGVHGVRLEQVHVFGIANAGLVDGDCRRRADFARVNDSRRADDAVRLDGAGRDGNAPSRSDIRPAAAVAEHCVQ